MLFQWGVPKRNPLGWWGGDSLGIETEQVTGMKFVRNITHFALTLIPTPIPKAYTYTPWFNGMTDASLSNILLSFFFNTTRRKKAPAWHIRFCCHRWAQKNAGGRVRFGELNSELICAHATCMGRNGWWLRWTSHLRNLLYHRGILSRADVQWFS